MGVMACDRYDCDSIMCNRYSSVFGYLCDDCFDELLLMGDNSDIQDFMQSSKLADNSSEFTYERLNEIFKEV